MIDNIRSWYTWWNEINIPTQKFTLANILIPWAVLKTGKIERNEENIALLEKTKQAQLSVLQLKKKPIENLRTNI